MPDFLDTLPNDLRELVLQARLAATRAYAPHSHFHVGCAIALPDGNVIPGCNVESDSLGLTCCSERTAIFSAVAQGHPGPYETMAVTCPDGDPENSPISVMPCGACRQVIHEFFTPEARIVVDGVGVFTPEDLLPLGFSLG